MFVSHFNKRLEIFFVFYKLVQYQKNNAEQIID